MTVTAIVARKNPDSERAALRAAIAAVAEAREQRGAIEAAVEAASHLAMACRQKLEKATKAIAVAKREDAERLADSLIHGAGTAPLQTIGRAREGEVAAADALDAARAAVVRLEADLKDVDREVEGADKAVRGAVAAIMAPLAEKMREEARDLRSKYLMRMYVTGAMVESGLDGVAPVLFDIREEEHRQFCAAVRRPWFDVIEALKRDADAPLPAIED
jgi:hypothetical protein